MSVKSRPQKCRIGYARISTLQQDLTRQIQALKSERCDKIFSDTASGKSTAGRPELAAAISALAPGDELLLAEWDRATRSMWDGMDIIKAVIDAGATIRVLDRSYIDLDTPIGRGFMAMFSALAEDERNRIIKRTHEGRKVSQGRGVKMGRKAKLNELQKAEARRRLAAGELPVDLAPLYGVSRQTIDRLRYRGRG
jgi:DNA invertase Pin-like site-specific DNA recombinase